MVSLCCVSCVSLSVYLDRCVLDVDIFAIHLLLTLLLSLSQSLMIVYKLTQGAAWSAGKMGRVDESRRYMEESLRARKMLPQFNLEGLWVGK